MACLLLVAECISLSILVHLDLNLNDLIEVLAIYIVSLIDVLQVNGLQILPSHILKTSSVPITELNDGRTVD